MPIEINDLESARFKVVSARLSDPTTSLDLVNEAARRLDVQLITTRVDSDNLHLVQKLEEDGYRLMDTLVYFIRDLSDTPPPAALASNEVIRRATPSDAPVVSKIAAAAFKGYIGHYHSDPRLANADADDVYVDWAETSVARSSRQSPALVVERGGKIVAFLTTDLEKNEIVLMGVHPDSKGGGIYGRLIDSGLGLLREEGRTQVVVSTQINNIAPQRAWVRRGFKPQRSVYTLHKWFF